MSFEFENEGRDIVGISMGGDGAGAKEAMEKQRSDKLIFDEVLREQKKINDKARAESDKEARERSAEILEQNAIEIFMTANPSFSWHDAKFLFDTELKQKIAIRRFEEAFFSEKPKGFGDVHL